MDGQPPTPAETHSLKDALRRARLLDADRDAALADLVAREKLRLDELHEALGPVLAQIPAGAALFDHGVVPGDPPRLFIDVLGFVEMARDRNAYRFLQDNRWGRRVVAESPDRDIIVRAVTDYIALRLIEREKALASDQVTGLPRPAPGAPFASQPGPAPSPGSAASPGPAAGLASAVGAQPAPATGALQPRRFLPGSVWFFLGALFGALMLFLVALIRAQTVGP